VKHNEFFDRPRQVGTGILIILSLVGPVVGIRTLLSSDSSSVVFIGVGTLFPPFVTAVLLLYISRYYNHHLGDTLLITSSIGSVLLAMLFALTAASIIWGQRTLGVRMADPLILITEMMLGGALFGLIYGHYYGLSLTQRRQLQQKTLQLRQQNERLDEFASMVSHDLRNPLNVAQGRLELAQRDGDLAHLEMVRDAHNRMATLIENILDLAQTQQFTVDRQPVEIESVVNQSWDHVETNEGTLVANLDGVIAADTGQLQRLFENLFRNAVEHGGTTVTITVGELENGFYVEDDGPGIPEEDRDDVLERGFSTAADNTGFGLAIVASIARAHDWTISIAESADGGARILVTDVEWMTR